MRKKTDDMLGEAYTDALLYGVGIIKIVNTMAGPKISHVPREEFMELAEHLKYVAENAVDLTTTPDKG
jgi:hypothetical protein